MQTDKAPEPRALAPWLYAAFLLSLVTGVYLSGLGNELVFDDLRLEDGTIFGRYGSLLEFRQRMLSYGSFVWLQDGFGEGWWKQRVFNLLLHLGVVGSLYAFTRALLDSAGFDDDITAQAHFSASRQAAVWVGVTVFALNPMAVYAVAYLIQRSIVMATLFAVLAGWTFVRGLQTRRWGWHVLSLAAYGLAVLSKEHAVAVAALAVPVYIHVRRPTPRQTAAIIAVALLLLGAAAAAFWQLYGSLIGRAFDPQSLEMIEQLEALRPGVGMHVYPLSVLNEAALFFAYGLLWIIPNVQWMAIDLRPAFPLSLGALPQVLGALAYVALLVGSAWLVIRQGKFWGLLAVLLLIPLLLYVTEFATVWIQDPFVLYRSYLWAMAMPGLLALVLTGFKPRTLYTLGLVLALVLALLSVERIASLKNPGTAWLDASEKIKFNAPANAVGRHRVFLNLGSHQLEQGHTTQARQSFASAIQLGDPGGKAWFNTGVALQQEKQHAEALQAFAQAESAGYGGQSLHTQRAESAYALGQYEQAFAHYDAALRSASDLTTGHNPTVEKVLRLRRAETATATNRFDVAVADYTALLQAAPGNPRLLHGLAMALIGQKQFDQAIEIFDALLARGPNAASHYGRALARHYAGQTEASLDDMRQAVRMEPRNPQYRSVLQQLLAAAKANAAAQADSPAPQ